MPMIGTSQVRENTIGTESHIARTNLHWQQNPHICALAIPILSFPSFTQRHAQTLTEGDSTHLLRQQNGHRVLSKGQVSCLGGASFEGITISHKSPLCQAATGCQSPLLLFTTNNNIEHILCRYTQVTYEMVSPYASAQMRTVNPSGLSFNTRFEGSAPLVSHKTKCKKRRMPNMTIGVV